MPHEFNTLDSVLDHPQMRGALRKFLASEYSSENLQFLEAVEAFKAACQDPNVSEQTLRQRATQISTLFVQPGSPSQVNLSSATLGVVQTELGNLATKNRAQLSTTFDAGSMDVSDMMMRDTFTRFKKSELSGNTVQKLDDIENLEAQMEKLKTSKSEQAKAIFQGGAGRAKRNLQSQIDEVRTSIDQSILTQPYVLPQLPVPAQVLPAPQVQQQQQPPVVVAQPPPVVVVQPPPPLVVAPPPPPQPDPLQVGDMSMAELAGIQQGRARGVDPSVKQPLQVEDMSMAELAGMQQGRSRAMNPNVKPGSNSLPSNDLGNDAPDTQKHTSVRDSLGKKPEAPNTVKPGQRTHV